MCDAYPAMEATRCAAKYLRKAAPSHNAPPVTPHRLEIPGQLVHARTSPPPGGLNPLATHAGNYYIDGQEGRAILIYDRLGARNLPP